MADQLRTFIPSIPAGTAEADPAVIELEMPALKVERIDWRVPHGSQGLMGWRLTMGGVQVLPTEGTLWVVGEGISGKWEVATLPDSGAWQLTGYNTGAYPHSLHIDMHLSVPSRLPSWPSVWTPAELAGVPDLSHAGPPVRSRP